MPPPNKSKDSLVPLVKDSITQKFVPHAPAAASAGVGGLSYIKDLARIGSVPGARAAAATTLAGTKAVTGALAKRAPIINGAIELGKGLAQLHPEVRKHAEANGRELMQRSPTYQVANAIVNPAEAMSGYGAVRESNARAYMDQKQKDFETSGVGKRVAGLNAQAEARDRKEASDRLGLNLSPSPLPRARSWDTAARGK